VLALLFNSLMILFLPMSTFREPVAMLRLTQGLAASMLLYGALVRSWRILNYSFLWVFTNILLVKGVAESGEAAIFILGRNKDSATTSCSKGNDEKVINLPA
jgi:hypothetical protein